MVREQAKVSIRRDEGQDTLRFPALETDTRMEADIIQQPGVLQSPGKEEQEVGIKHPYFFQESNLDAVYINTHTHCSYL